MSIGIIIGMNSFLQSFILESIVVVISSVSVVSVSVVLVLVSVLVSISILGGGVISTDYSIEVR